ncbi:thiolase C-terminal domain-containing protein [Rhabdothermincola sediminis]|uniref:thiolase C-terminal domain-containing protein n=1 Tax=Rhabdothermincola sediminis TaxID=2751370 RepID=UPI001AA0229E|nr:OB-fold domain-containing protein [Rhabdothermincola sediminis]
MSTHAGSAAQGPIRPQVTADSRSFWAGCQEGVLRLPACRDCGYVLYPPGPVCPQCRSRSLGPKYLEPEGRVYSLSVSHQPARPDLAVPYTIVIVELDAAPEVRMTMRVRPADQHAGLAIGDPVRIGFEQVDEEFAVPVADPLAGEAGGDRHRSELGRVTFAKVSGGKPEHRAVIAGVGQSEVGRRLMRSELDLTVDAALAAIADAGLAPGDIDGIAAYPGAGIGPPGYAGPHTDQVAAALGLELAWHRAGAEGAGQLQPIIDAVLAVAGGLCTHALVYRTSIESTVGALMRAGAMAPPPVGPAGGFAEWLLPFDAVTPAHWLAPYAARHQHQFGTTRAQLGAVALTARANAARTPGAVMTEPLTIEDYLGSRPIATPLHLLDCDVPVDGSTAVVVSRADRAVDLPGPAVRIEAMGTGVGLRPSWHQWPDLTTMAASGAAATMWARTDLAPADVDVAQLYDGFSFLALFWLEALGFCEHGDGGPFVEGGGRIALGGELPLNTGGGQLSGGRLHGWGLLREACLQLRRQATGRQIEAEVAMVSTGGGPVAGCLLLTRAG